MLMSHLLFIDILDLIPFQVFLILILLILKMSMKYRCLESLRGLENKFR